MHCALSQRTKDRLHAASSASQTRQQPGLSHVVEVIMWNRFMSSPYAHFITAIALTLGLAFGLLAEQPGKMGAARFEASAQKAPSAAMRPELASSAAHPVTTGPDR